MTDAKRTNPTSRQPVPLIAGPVFSFESESRNEPASPDKLLEQPGWAVKILNRCNWPHDVRLQQFAGGRFAFKDGFQDHHGRSSRAPQTAR